LPRGNLDVVLTVCTFHAMAIPAIAR